MNKDKIKDKLVDLVFFSLVPISQLVLYFTVGGYVKGASTALDELQKSLNMSSNQMMLFEGITVLIFSIISFVFTYFISRLIMGFVDREHRDTKYLFASLVISTGLANLLSIIVSNIFKTVYPLVPALAMFVLLPYFYYSGTKHKDLKGTIVLLILSFVLNVVPNLFNL